MIRAGLLLIIIGLLPAGCQRPPDGMVLIPAGEFVMGSDEEDTEGTALEYGIVKPWFEDEHPQRRINLPAYYIDQFEVTNEQYHAYVSAMNRRPPWREGRPPQGEERYPVTRITWEEANGYCAWAGKALPTEAQWEKAARGTDGRIYPWGNEFDPEKANVGGRHGGPRPVGSFEAGKSPYGAYDMVGNLWEWTADWYDAYPGQQLTGEFYENKLNKKFKTIRGLSWSPIGHYSADDALVIMAHYGRAPYRLFFYPNDTLEDLGFRCVKPA
ncbi:MAG: SUMF1/EgtB/PvdO family nonheme iron enzyme [Nitrospirota bacterium]